MGKFYNLKDNPGLVSVIIPVHDRFEMANRAIDSVLQQTYRPIEIMVIDDLSKEVYEYPKKINEGEGISLKVIRMDKNVGPGLAREKGRERCNGNFIVYLDSDDKYEPEFINKLAKYLEENPQIDMVYCHAKFMSPEGEISNESVKKTNLAYSHILPFLLTHGRPWHSSGCMRRRSLIDKIGPWGNLWFWEDYDYDARAAIINNKIGYVPEVLCFIDKDNIVKITRNPDTPKKNRSYGNAIYNIAKNIHLSGFDKYDLRNRVIYHLMKSAARNLDHGFYDIAHQNLKMLLNWTDIYKSTNFVIHILLVLNSLKLRTIVSKVLRKVCQKYKYS